MGQRKKKPPRKTEPRKEVKKLVPKEEDEEEEKEARGPGKLLVEYVSIAGSIFFVVNALWSSTWKDVIRIILDPTGQTVLVGFGAVAVILLWIVGRFRG